MSEPDGFSIELTRGRPRRIGLRLSLLVLVLFLWLEAVSDWRQFAYRWEEQGSSPLPGVTLFTLDPKGPFGEPLEVVAIGRVIVWERAEDPLDPLLLLSTSGPAREPGVRLVREKAVGPGGGMLTIGVAAQRGEAWHWLEGEAMEAFLVDPPVEDGGGASIDAGGDRR